MADYTPVYADGVRPFTKTASAAVTGGQLVEVTTAGSVGPAGAASVKCIGVAAHDAAIGARVTVWPLPGVEHEVVHTAGGAVGDTITPAAAGAAASTAAATAAAAGTDIGIATSTATAGNKIRFVGK
jgi:hypothetical protein